MNLFKAVLSVGILLTSKLVMSPSTSNVADENQVRNELSESLFETLLASVSPLKNQTENSKDGGMSFKDA